MYHDHRSVRRTRRAGLLAVATCAALVLGACGDDDDDAAESSATTAAAAEETTAGADTTAAGADTTAAGADTTAAGADTTAAGADTTAAGADTTAGSDTTGGAAGEDVDVFCQAELDAEAAANGEDPSAAGPAFEALVAAAPEEIRPAVEQVVANAQSGPGSPEFDEPYGEMLDFMRENCGFTEVDVTGEEYAFVGLPEELPAGGAIFGFENVGNEVHEIAIFRVNDGVTESAEELLALPEEEAFSKVTPAGFAFAFPGTSASGTTDLTPGRYIAACFLPTGATPEVISQMEGPESSPPPGAELGPPHFMQGMVAEFTVTG